MRLGSTFSYLGVTSHDLHWYLAILNSTIIWKIWNFAKQRFHHWWNAKLSKLSTNSAYERYVARLEEAGVTEALQARASQQPEQFRATTIEIMTALNPGRVFPIQMPVQEVFGKWHEALTNLDLSDIELRVDAANSLLPGRINAFELSEEVNSALDNAAAQAASGATSAQFQEAAAAFLDVATSGHYRIVDNHVVALEFTAIYPVGTAQASKKTKYGTLPDFGVTGVWPLVAREKGRGITGMVDYLSSNPGYGFITMIAYQPAGGRLLQCIPQCRHSYTRRHKISAGGMGAMSPANSILTNPTNSCGS